MSGRLKLGIVATVILALSVVGVLANERFRGASDDAVPARETGRATEKPDGVKATGKRLKLGTVAKVSPNYRVAVTELTLYNFSTGRIMVVTVKATYIGKDDGEPWADLTVAYSGKDSRTAGESACPFDLEELDASDQATLKTGDATTYGVCIDLPAGTVEGGRVSVEEAFSEQAPTSWSTDEAVTKTPPAGALPNSSGGGRAPATQFRPRSGNSSDVKEECEKYEDDVEEYRDGRGELDELAERYENRPDHDDDKLEDYEEWRDAMDKNVEQYERLCE